MARVSKDICYGDCEEFAKEMVKMINAEEFRYVHTKMCELAFIYTNKVSLTSVAVI